MAKAELEVPFVFASCFCTRTQTSKVCPTVLNAGVTKAGQARANRIPLLYPCYTFTIFLHFAYKTMYFDRFLPENLRMCK